MEYRVSHGPEWTIPVLVDDGAIRDEAHLITIAELPRESGGFLDGIVEAILCAQEQR